jgi:hypothetical protein
VTNFLPAGVGQPATSQQYVYLSLINGLTADQIFTTSLPTLQNETTAASLSSPMPSPSVSSAIRQFYSACSTRNDPTQRRLRRLRDRHRASRT